MLKISPTLMLTKAVLCLVSSSSSSPSSPFLLAKVNHLFLDTTTKLLFKNFIHNNHPSSASNSNKTRKRLCGRMAPVFLSDWQSDLKSNKYLAKVKHYSD